MTAEREFARLDTVAPGLVDLIRAATPDEQRRIALAAARRAVVDAGVEDPVLVSTVGSGAADAAALDHVRRVAGVLDQQSFELQDDVDAGRAAGRDHAIAFARARAASAVAFALDQDALEAVYEAWHAVDDTAGLTRVVENSGVEW